MKVVSDDIVAFLTSLQMSKDDLSDEWFDLRGFQMNWNLLVIAIFATFSLPCKYSNIFLVGKIWKTFFEELEK